MKSKIALLVVTLTFAVSSFAGPAVVNVVTNPNQVLGKFKALAGNTLYATYDSAGRTDKVYYQIEHNYLSDFKKTEISELLNPVNNHLPKLFKDPITVRKLRGNSYSMTTTMTVLGQTMEINGVIDYSVSSNGSITTHNYDFHDFDRLFTSTKIKVDTQETASETRVNITQVSIIKGTAYNKLKSVPLATTVLKNKLMANIKKFHDEIGGQ